MIVKSSEKVKTGFNNANIRFQRRAVGVTKVTDPTLKFQVGTGWRAGQVGAKPPFDFNVLNKAYLADSYVRQGVDKYVEIILKEGFRLDGESEPVKYLYRRLDLMTIMGGEPWQVVFERGIRDLVKYGNTFFLRKRTSNEAPFPGSFAKPLYGKTPIGAYFNIPVNTLTPDLDDTGKIRNWIQVIQNRKAVFSVNDVIHFAYCKDPGGIWGQPPNLSVIEDVRALRQCEESVLKLIYKSLTPLIHQETPDITGTGEGRIEDIDDAVRNWQTSAPDGFIVTPPGHKLSVIGAESHAIRAEGYLDIFKKRVFTGLGVSELIMGEQGAGLGTAEALTAQMIHRAKMYQILLSQYITVFILNELLMEGGYDPWNKEEDRVVWAWNEIEIERQIKEQTHALNLWTMNLLSATEARDLCKYKEEPDWSDFYAHRVQIPQLVASKIAMDPLELSDSELKKMVTDATVPTKDKTSTSVSKTGKQAKPSTNTKANAPTAHKMTAALNSLEETIEALLKLIPEIKEGKKTEKDLLALFPLENESYLLPLCKTLVNDILSQSSETMAYVRVNARLCNERAFLLSLLIEDSANV